MTLLQSQLQHLMLIVLQSISVFFVNNLTVALHYSLHHYLSSESMHLYVWTFNQYTVHQWCKQDQILKTKTKTKITKPRPRLLLTRPRSRPI